ILVLFPNTLEVDRERRIPISKMFRAGDSRIFRNQVFIRSQAFYGNHGSETKPGGFSFKLSSFMPYVVVERNWIARSRAEFTRSPLVEDNVFWFSYVSRSQQFQT